MKNKKNSEAMDFNFRIYGVHITPEPHTKDDVPDGYFFSKDTTIDFIKKEGYKHVEDDYYEKEGWSADISESFINSEFKVEINGTTFPIQKEVFELLKETSIERDNYKLIIGN